MEFAEFFSHITLYFLIGLVLGVGLWDIVGFFVLRYIGGYYRDFLQLTIKDNENMLKEREQIRTYYQLEIQRLKQEMKTKEEYFKSALTGGVYEPK